MKDRAPAVRRFWRPCVRQDKPPGERHNLILVPVEFVFLCRSQLAPALALKAGIVLPNLFSECSRVQGIHRERGRITRRPPILHAIALFGVLALCSPVELISAVPARHVKISKVRILSTDRGRTRENRCSGQTEGSSGFYSRHRRTLLPNLAGHENKNIVPPVGVGLRCFDHCPRCQLHGHGSSKARWRNDNDNRYRGWRSPIREGQYFPEHRWHVPESSLHGFYSISERSTVSQSSALRRENGVCVWENQSL